MSRQCYPKDTDQAQQDQGSDGLKMQYITELGITEVVLEATSIESAMNVQNNTVVIKPVDNQEYELLCIYSTEGSSGLTLKLEDAEATEYEYLVKLMNFEGSALFNVQLSGTVALSENTGIFYLDRDAVVFFVDSIRVAKQDQPVALFYPNTEHRSYLIVDNIISTGFYNVSNGIRLLTKKFETDADAVAVLLFGNTSLDNLSDANGIDVFSVEHERFTANLCGDMNSIVKMRLLTVSAPGTYIVGVFCMNSVIEMPNLVLAEVFDEQAELVVNINHNKLMCKVCVISHVTNLNIGYNDFYKTVTKMCDTFLQQAIGTSNVTVNSLDKATKTASTAIELMLSEEQMQAPDGEDASPVVITLGNLNVRADTVGIKLPSGRTMPYGSHIRLVFTQSLTQAEGTVLLDGAENFSGTLDFSQLTGEIENFNICRDCKNATFQIITNYRTALDYSQCRLAVSQDVYDVLDRKIMRADCLKSQAQTNVGQGNLAPGAATPVGTAHSVLAQRQKSDSGMSTWAVAAIAVGCSMGVICVVVLSVVIGRRRSAAAAEVKKLKSQAGGAHMAGDGLEVVDQPDQRNAPIRKHQRRCDQQ